MHGRSDPLDSAFRLTYGTITNLTRLEGTTSLSGDPRQFEQAQGPGAGGGGGGLERERDDVRLPSATQTHITDYVAGKTLATLSRHER